MHVRRIGHVRQRLPGLGHPPGHGVGLELGQRAAEHDAPHPGLDGRREQDVRPAGGVVEHLPGSGSGGEVGGERREVDQRVRAPDDPPRDRLVPQVSRRGGVHLVLGAERPDQCLAQQTPASRECDLHGSGPRSPRAPVPICAPCAGPYHPAGTLQAGGGRASPPPHRRVPAARRPGGANLAGALDYARTPRRTRQLSTQRPSAPRTRSAMRRRSASPSASSVAPWACSAARSSTE